MCGLNQTTEACSRNVIDKYDAVMGLLDKVMMYVQVTGETCDNHLLLGWDETTNQVFLCAKRDRFDYAILRANTKKDYVIIEDFLPVYGWNEYILLYRCVQSMTKSGSLYLDFDPTDLLSFWFHGVVQCSKDSMELKTKQIGLVQVEI